MLKERVLEAKIEMVNEENEVLAYVTFPIVKPGVVEIDHTFVDESLRGMGIAGKLLSRCYETLKERNLKAIPVCSYAVGWFNKNEDKRDILA